MYVCNCDGCGRFCLTGRTFFVYVMFLISLLLQLICLFLSFLSQMSTAVKTKLSADMRCWAFHPMEGFFEPFWACCCTNYITLTAALVRCCTMKYYLIKCYEGFGIFLSADKRLPSKHISFLGWCCKAPHAESWTQNILFSVKHIFGTTSGFISC